MVDDPLRSVRSFRKALLSATLGAMGCSGSSFVPETAPVAVGESLLADATYVAFIVPISAEAGFGGERGPAIVHERGDSHCRQLAEVLTQRSNEGTSPQDPLPPIEGCSPDAMALLLGHADTNGKVVVALTPTGQRVIRSSDLGTIDSPSEALLAVWFSHQYDLTFPADEKQDLGSVAAGYARAKGGAFQVIASEERRGDPIDDEEMMDECPRYERKHYRVVLEVARDGTMRVVSDELMREWVEHVRCRPLGRRPEHFAWEETGGGLEEHLACAMHHEAESVRAFLRLERELEAHGAPDAWIEKAHRAAEEERRHAAMVGVLAHELGGWTLSPYFATDELPVRDLEAVALENAVEGCVLEAYAAMVAQHQALRATDPRVRRHFATIADDELGHAALARACHGFFLDRLDPDARARVQLAMRRACEDLRDDVVSDPTTGVLGEPDALHAAQLVDALSSWLAGPVSSGLT